MNIHSAIIKGPNKNKLQDAVKIVNKQDYTLLIVADGLGSAKQSDFGSKKAVIAVEKAIIEWRKLENNDIKVLIQLVHFFWNLFINDSEFEKKECATTCLFSFIEKKNNKIILAQLGDGLIFLSKDDQEVILTSNEEYNFTKSLGGSKSFSDWNIKVFENVSTNFQLMLTSDGVSEDIVENEEKEFVGLLINNMNQLKKKKRNKYLMNLLENWPTKFHSDDKTICIAWEKK